MKNLRPNAHRAKIAIIFIWIVMAMDIISMISGYLQYGLLKSAAEGIPFSEDTADANDTREAIIGIIYFVIYIISAVTFIMWFRRAYYNISLKVRNFRFSDDWAAGAWFVPIINLYRPFQIMKDMFVETRKYISKNEIKSKNNLNIDIVNWWWFFWILNNIIAQFNLRYSMKADTIDELLFSTKVDIFNSLIGIPLAIITVEMIKNYSKIEPEIIRMDEIDEEKETKLDDALI